MSTYTYKELTYAMNLLGFEEVKSNNGSHQSFEHKKAGFKLSVPKHPNGMVSPGVSKKLLSYAVMIAIMTKQNPKDIEKKLSKSIYDYIKQKWKEIKKDPTKAIPDEVRKQKNLIYAKDVVDFVHEKMISLGHTPTSNNPADEIVI